MDLNELAEEAFKTAVERGKYKISNNSELSLQLLRECLEFDQALQKGEYAKCGLGYEIGIKGAIEDELADILITVLSIARYLRVDIKSHVAMKMKYNKTRD